MSDQPVSEHRILKIATCLSLSGRTDLTYHVGCTEDRDVCFRIWDTSGKGIHSKEWVCASLIHKTLNSSAMISAPMLLPLFKVGRSVNTAGFLLAALRNEGLVAHDPEVAHKYVRVQSNGFVEEMNALMDAGTSLDPVADAPAVGKVGKRGNRKAAAAPAWAGSAESTAGQ